MSTPLLNLDLAESFRVSAASAASRAAAPRRAAAGCASRCCTSSCSAGCCSRSTTSWPARPTIRTRSSSAPTSTARRPRRSRRRAATSPNADELEALHRVWLDNEVLYREGLALQVDKGDTAIRERVIFKALSVVDSNVKLPPADDQVLRTWFEAHRDKYDEPARYDFEEAALSGDNSEADGARVRGRAEQRHAGRRQGGPARVQGTTARQPGRELRRRVRQDARSDHARQLAGAANARRLARDAAERDHAAPSRPCSRSCAAWCCRTGPTPPLPNSAPPPCARWPRSTRSTLRDAPRMQRGSGE